MVPMTSHTAPAARYAATAPGHPANVELAELRAELRHAHQVAADARYRERQAITAADAAADRAVTAEAALDELRRSVDAVAVSLAAARNDYRRANAQGYRPAPSYLLGAMRSAITDLTGMEVR